MAAENFKVKKGLEVGTAITATSSGVNVTGVVTATQFVGDGSGLTGVTGSGSGVIVKHDGSAVGTAGTINFSTNLDVSAISAGIVTITASGITTENVVTDSLVVSGISTFQNNITASGTSRFEIASMENGELDGSITHTGDVTTLIKFPSNNNISLDTAGTTRLNINNSGVIVTGVATATSFVGALTGAASTSNTVSVSDESSSISCFPLFVTASVAGGLVQAANLAPKAGSNLSFDSVNGKLQATKFTGVSLIATGDILQISSSGISTFTGNIDANGNLDVDGQTDLDDVVVAGVSTFNDGITLGTNSTTFAAKFVDNAVANFGTDNDLQISHDNSNALIRNSTGKIVVVGVVSATSGANITGVVTATTFSGSGASLTNLPSGQLSGALPALDGSALTGVTASGSGVVVKHDGTTVGTAGTINFSTNLDVTAVSAGIVTITASGGGSGITTENVVADSLVVSGITTADQGVRVNADSGNPDPDSATNYFSVGESQDLKIYHNGGTNYIASRDGDIQIRSDTFMLVSDDTAGRAIYLDNSNSRLELGFDGTAAAYITNSNVQFLKPITGGINITGVATATSFSGSGASLTSLDAGNLGVGTIPNGRFPATLPAVSGANLTALNASEITSGTLPIARIDDDAVTFAKMQNVGTGVIIGRNDGGTGDIETLSAADVRTLINVENGATADQTAAEIRTLVESASDSNVFTDADHSKLDGIAAGATAGITTSPDNVVGTWSVTANGSSAYRFTGPGQDGSEDNPDIYLVRGQRYSFINTTGSSHPFRFRVSSGGSTYSDGVSGSENGTQYFNVQHDAPASLVYQCTIHSGMVGNIYIVGQHLANGANNRVLTATSAYGMNGEANLTFDGSSLDVFNGSNSSTIKLKRHASTASEQAHIGYFSSGLHIETREATDLSLKTNTQERLRIDDQGDVFIGTTSDIAPANGTNLCVSDATIARLILEKQSTIKFGLNVSSGFTIYDETNDAARFTIDSSGRLLIGGATSTHGSTNADDLQIGANNQSNQTGITLGSASASSIRFADAGSDTAGALTYQHSDDYMSITAGGNEKFRIESNGRQRGYSSSGTFAAFRETFQSSGTLNNGDTFAVQTYNCHAGGLVTITANRTPSGSNHKTVKIIPILLNSTSNASLGTEVDSMSANSGSSFTVAGSSRGITVTNTSGTGARYTITFDITGI